MPRNLYIHRLITMLVMFVFVLATFAAPASAKLLESTAYFAVPKPALDADCTQQKPCSLQAAVNMAANNDVIYLKGGDKQYTSTAEQVVLINKSVVLQGGWDGGAIGRPKINMDANPTYLDGEYSRRVMQITNPAAPTLRGLTILAGYTNSSGGGIYIDSSGGGALIEHSHLNNNSATSYGGGVYVASGTLTIRDSELLENTTVYGGGAVMASMGTSVIMERNVVEGNNASYGSLGHFDQASLIARSNHIFENPGNTLVSINGGNGLHFNLENNIIDHNEGTAIVGGSMQGSVITILHNTMVENGKCIDLPGDSSGTIANNIFTASEVNSILLVGGSNVTVSNNLFWQNEADSVKGTNPVEADPLLTGTFHLFFGSPAIDAGINANLTEDFDGEKRPVGLPDIGADEHQHPYPVFIPLSIR